MTFAFNNHVRRIGQFLEFMSPEGEKYWIAITNIASISKVPETDPHEPSRGMTIIMFDKGALYGGDRAVLTETDPETFIRTYLDKEGNDAS